MDDVLLALHAQAARLLRLRPRSELEQLPPPDHLGPDEAALQIGVDDPGALGRPRAGMERPGTRLLLTGGEERAPVEQVVRRARAGGARSR